MGNDDDHHAIDEYDTDGTSITMHLITLIKIISSERKMSDLCAKILSYVLFPMLLEGMRDHRLGLYSTCLLLGH